MLSEEAEGTVMQRLARRRLDKLEAPPEIPDLMRLLFKPQLEFFSNPAPQKAACCSRRSGKSEGVALSMVHDALRNPGASYLYIVRSREQAVNAFWKKLLKIQQKHGIEFHWDHKAMVATLSSNGASISCVGGDEEYKLDNLLGGNFRRVVIDEAHTFKSHIRVLINEVIGATLTDDPESQLILIGTPPRYPGTYFQSLWEGKEGRWLTKTWTWFENPHHPAYGNPVLYHRIKWVDGRAVDDGPQTWIDEYAEQKGAKVTDPFIQRDAFGRMIVDTSASFYDRLPEPEPAPVRDDSWRYLLGIDVGFVQPTAMVVIGYRPGNPTVWVLESSTETKMQPHAVVAKARALRERYGEGMRIVVDSGGIGRPYLDALQERFGIGVTAANKQEKLAYMLFMKDDLRAGKIRFDLGTEAVRDEVTQIVLNDANTDVEAHLDDHQHDALLYAWRHAYAWIIQEADQEPEIVYGSPEYLAKIAREHREATFRNARRGRDRMAEMIERYCRENG